MNSRSRLISWQCYTSFIRILSISYALGYWIYQAGVYPGVDPLNAHSISGFVFGTIVLLNDAFMSVYRTTDTYLGCVITQVAVNCCFCGLIILHVVLDAQWEFFEYFNYSYYSTAAAFEIFILLGGLCSLGLLSISLWPMFALRSYVSVQQLCKTNTKDAFKGMSLPAARPRTLSVLGHLREKETRSPRPLAVVGRFIKNCLFRRISPVETRVYAFSRNSFATVAIGILIFRTIAALQQAQNEINTRVTSRTCDDASQSHYISVLSDRVVSDSVLKNPLPNLNISVGIVFTDPWSIQGGYRDQRVQNCTRKWSQIYKSVIDVWNTYESRTSELFVCYSLGFSIGGRPLQYIPREYLYTPPYYRIDVQPMAVASQTRLSNDQMPRIWLLNTGEYLGPKNYSLSEASEVQMYLPPLELLHGSRIIAKANLVTRRFLKSSIVKDIISRFKSEYRSLSLYPMVEASVVPLNASDANVATAIIRPVLTPGLMYHRNQVDARNINGNPDTLCDYIDDYRSSTIIGVIGSIGGLFALLQTMHLLLFGRPLLWGLIGAKMITPFGLLGQCSSRSFRRRLKEGYHVTSSEDGAETIRIVKFLQDFVIDFGPANVDLEQRPVSPVPGNNDNPADA